MVLVSLHKRPRSIQASHKTPFHVPISLESDQEKKKKKKRKNLLNALWILDETHLQYFPSVFLIMRWTYSKNGGFILQFIFFLVDVPRFLSLGDNDALWSRELKGFLGLGL